MKFFKRLCAFFLSSLVLIGCCLYTKEEKVLEQDNVAVRTIEVAQTTYQEQVESVINDFESYTIDTSNESLCFNGILPMSLGELIGFDGLSTETYQAEKRVTTNYDYKTNIFRVEVSVWSKTNLIESWNEVVSPLYDEEKDEGYIEFEGQRYYFSDCLGIESLNECIAGVDDAIVIGGGTLAVVALAVTIVVTPPSVHEEIINTVTEITETVVQTVRSFWRWFKRWITKTFTRTRKVTTTTVQTVYTPTLEIDGIQIKTKEVSLTDLKKENLYPSGKFYLCYVSSKIYISTVEISQSAAIAVLKSGIVQVDKNTGKEMLASTFTRGRNDAFTIASIAGLNPRTPYEKPDFEKGAYHYHSSVEVFVNNELRSPHSFYLI